MSAARPLIIGLVFALAVPATGATAASGPSPEPAPAANDAKVRNCHTPYMVRRTAQRIQVTGVGCKTGVKVAITVGDEGPSGCVTRVDAKHIELARPCVRRGYRCTGKPHLDGGVLNATCKRGGKTIRFQY